MARVDGRAVVRVRSGCAPIYSATMLSRSAPSVGTGIDPQ
jgi:hypothetical protein